MKEIKKVTVKVPQVYLDFMNQIFEIEKKVNLIKEENSVQRNINKLNGLMEEEFFKHEQIVGFSYHNPLGEMYTQTRTDCEATIQGNDNENLEIIEVIKPIIFCIYKDYDKILKSIVQAAVVIVKSKTIH